MVLPCGTALLPAPRPVGFADELFAALVSAAARPLLGAPLLGAVLEAVDVGPGRVVLDTAPALAKLDIAPVLGVLETAPVLGVLETAPALGVLETAPVFGVLETAPALGVLETAPVLGVLETAPVLGVLETAPVLGVLETAPVLGVLETAPALGVLETAPVFGVLETAPVLGVSETAPVLGVSEAAPVLAKLEIAPVLDVLEPPPVLAVLETGLAVELGRTKPFVAVGPLLGPPALDAVGAGPGRGGLVTVPVWTVLAVELGWPGGLVALLPAGEEPPPGMLETLLDTLDVTPACVAGNLPPLEDGSLSAGEALPVSGLPDGPGSLTVADGTAAWLAALGELPALLRLGIPLVLGLGAAPVLLRLGVAAVLTALGTVALITGPLLLAVVPAPVLPADTLLSAFCVTPVSSAPATTLVLPVLMTGLLLTAADAGLNGAGEAEPWRADRPAGPLLPSLLPELQFIAPPRGPLTLAVKVVGAASVVVLLSMGFASASAAEPEVGAVLPWAVPAILVFLSADWESEDTHKGPLLLNGDFTGLFRTLSSGVALLGTGLF